MLRTPDLDAFSLNGAQLKAGPLFDQEVEKMIKATRKKIENLIGMASNLEVMASKLLAMASNLLGGHLEGRGVISPKPPTHQPLTILYDEIHL